MKVEYLPLSNNFGNSVFSPPCSTKLQHSRNKKNNFHDHFEVKLLLCIGKIAKCKIKQNFFRILF